MHKISFYVIINISLYLTSYSSTQILRSKPNLEPRSLLIPSILTPLTSKPSIIFEKQTQTKKEIKTTRPRARQAFIVTQPMLVYTRIQKPTRPRLKIALTSKQTQAQKPTSTQVKKQKPTSRPTPKITPKSKQTQAQKPTSTQVKKQKPTSRPTPTIAPKSKQTQAQKPTSRLTPTIAPKSTSRPRPTVAPKSKHTQAQKPTSTQVKKQKPTSRPTPKITPKSKQTQAQKPTSTQVKKQKSTPKEILKPGLRPSSRLRPKQIPRTRPTPSPKETGLSSLSSATKLEEREQIRNILLENTSLNYRVKANDVPYIVVFIHDKLKYPENFLCEGSIINYNTILSSALCCKNMTSFEDIYVVPGMIRYDEYKSKSVRYKIQNCRAHESFNNAFLKLFDIAIFKIKNEFSFNDNVKSVVYAFEKEPEPSMLCAMASWKVEIGGDIRDSKYIIGTKFLKILGDKTKCEEDFVNYEQESFLCVSGRKNSVDACIGDYGSALVCQGVQYGILSEIASHCENGSTILFTNIYHYKEWIIDAVNCSDEKSKFSVTIDIIFIILLLFY